MKLILIIVIVKKNQNIKKTPQNIKNATKPKKLAFKNKKTRPCIHKDASDESN